MLLNSTWIGSHTEGVLGSECTYYRQVVGVHGTAALLKRLADSGGWFSRHNPLVVQQVVVNCGMCVLTIVRCRLPCRLT